MRPKLFTCKPPLSRLPDRGTDLPEERPLPLPDLASLAALRAWHEGLTARAAVTRYLAHVRDNGQSSRGVIARIRRQLVACATARQRDDLIPLFTGAAVTRMQCAAHVVAALDALRTTQVPRRGPPTPSAGGSPRARRVRSAQPGLARSQN